MEEILGGVVHSMLVLNAAKQRELVVRTHVQLERLHAGPASVVDAFGILAVRFAARLPVALQHCARAIGEWPEELCVAERRGDKAVSASDDFNSLPTRLLPHHRATPQ